MYYSLLLLTITNTRYNCLVLLLTITTHRYHLRFLGRAYNDYSLLRLTTTTYLAAAVEQIINIPTADGSARKSAARSLVRGRARARARARGRVRVS